MWKKQFSHGGAGGTLTTFTDHGKGPEAERSGSKPSLSYHMPGLTWLKNGADKAYIPQRGHERGPRSPMASASQPSMASESGHSGKRPPGQDPHSTQLICTNIPRKAGHLCGSVSKE